MTYPPEWPAPGKMHFRLEEPRLGALDLHCDNGYVVNAYNLGFPEIREVKVPNSLDDGTFDVTRFYGARVVSMDVTLKTHTGITPVSPFIAPESVLRDRLIGYLYPGIRSRLLFSENGDPRVRQVMIRGTSASLAVSQASYNKVNVSWVAPRGALSSYDERCYLYVFSVTSDDAMTLSIVNEGTVPVDWRAAISGYLVHPRFTLNGTQVLQLIYDADPGDIIALDSFSRTITINGKPASYTYGVNAPEWFKIPPGISTLTVEHDHFAAQPGYPYAYWQEPSVPPVSDDFARADGPLGAAWATPTAIPAGTTSVPVAINSGAVVVTVADDGTGPHEWGFARNTTAITGGAGQYVEVDVSNLAQSSTQGPAARSKVELYTNMNTGDAASQVLSVDFAYGQPPAQVAPIVAQDPFDTVAAWTTTGGGISIISDGRNGNGLQVTGTSALSYPIPDVSEADTVVVGAYVRVVQPTGGGISSTRNIFELRSDNGATLHGTVAIAIGGSLYATDAAGNNRGGSPDGAILPNAWYYIEARYTLSDTDGEYALRIDGIDVAGAFDLDTRNGGTKTVYDTVSIPVPNPTSGGTHQYDDFYLAAGPDAAFTGPQAVANGSLDWSLHQYDPGGAAVSTVASGSLPYNYDDTAVRLRLESGTDGEQRFLLNGTPVAAAVEDTPIVGGLVGFGANWQSFPATVVTFTDDFERIALGADWGTAAPRNTQTTATLPVITAGAAVSATPATAVYPFISGTSTNNTGTTLVGGVAQPNPPSVAAGDLLLAYCIQDNPATIDLSASSGWTQIASNVQGVNVIKMAVFARLATGTSPDILTLTGAATEYCTVINRITQHSVADLTTDIRAAAAAAATGNADPPNLNAVFDRNWLWLTAAGLDIASFPAPFDVPSGYSYIQDPLVSATTKVALQSGYYTSGGTTAQNPGTFTNPSRPSISFTIAVAGSRPVWAVAEHVSHGFDPARTITVEGFVGGTVGDVELYTHMINGTPDCRVLAVDMAARTWRMGHYVTGTDGIVVAASGSLPAGTAPFTLRFETDPDRTERFLFNGTLVQTAVDTTAPTLPAGTPTRAGLGVHYTTASPQVRDFAATGMTAPVGSGGTSPRIERFTGAPVSGTNWAIPPGTVPANNPPPGGKPPWAWTPPVDPITGEPSILTVHFCFFDQWI